MATPADAPVTLLPPETWQAPAQAAFEAVTRELALLLPKRYACAADARPEWGWKYQE